MGYKVKSISCDPIMIGIVTQTSGFPQVDFMFGLHFIF